MDDVRARIAGVRAAADAVESESASRSDGVGRTLAVSSVVLAALSLSMVAVVALTLRRRAEAETLRRVALARDEFVGFVAHELRSPIAVISGNARMVAEGPDALSPGARTSLSEITFNAERLQATVATLLSLAKAEAGGQLEVEPVLIHRVAEAAARHHYQRFPTREVRLEIPPAVPPVMADRDAMEQVILNLLQNAEKYSHADSPVRLEVVHEPETVSVHVINEGDILDPQQFTRIFEPFFRMGRRVSEVEGVGLGLTVCQRLMAAQGGEMTAEAIPAGGARFSFRLPVASVEREEA